MESNKKSKIYLIIPQILFFTILSLFLVAAILAILIITVDDSHLREKILKIEYTVLIIQGFSAIIVLFKTLFMGLRTESEEGFLFLHSIKALLLKQISPLKTLQQRYQQVLISKFNLSRSDNRVTMDVSFSNNNLAIWNDLGKREIEKRFLNIPQSEIDEIQRKLDQILIRGETNKYQYDNKKYPFRYASGGALPIVTIGQTQYYCLIYREIPPVGWNIANGGCDSQEEMLKPSNTIVRELNEELIIFEPNLKEWYFYEKFHDLPDHNICREYLYKQYPRGFFDDFKRKDALTEFQEGPDILKVSIEKEFRNTVNTFNSIEEGCFININSHDYGIEFDKIAHIKVGKDAVFVDCEPFPYSKISPIVNAPIGLFKKGDLDDLVRRECEVFMPDFFFWDALRRPRNLVINHDGNPEDPVDPGEVRENLDTCIDMFLVTKRAHMPDALKVFDKLRKENGDKIYNLCPVTRSIIKRL